MWLIILTLLFIGLALIVVEVIFIPGTTIIGVVGVIFSVAGVVISFRHFGNETGYYVLAGAGVTNLIFLILAFRAEVWTKFSLKTTSDSRVNEGQYLLLQVGDKGKTVSTLRPFGKAEFNEKQYEVKAFGSYVEHGKDVQVVQITSNQIIVEPTN